MTTTAPSAQTEPTAPAAAPRATTSNTLGILSLVFGVGSIVTGFHPLLGIAGIVLGIIALRREPTSRGLAIGGLVTSAVSFAGLVFGAAALLIFLPFLAFFGQNY